MSVNKNIMKVNWGVIFSCVVLWALPASLVFADYGEPWFTKQLKTSGVLLSPGASAYCNRSFMIENMSQKNAEVQVIMGNEDMRYVDTLGADDKLAYFQTFFETDKDKETHVNEAHIVNTGLETVKFHCK